MSYRFSLNGLNVECDSLEELLAVAPPTAGDYTPGNSRTRARLSKGKKKAGKKRRARGSAGWAAAKYYADNMNSKLSYAQARHYLAAHPKMKAKVLAAIAG